MLKDATKLHLPLFGFTTVALLFLLLSFSAPTAVKHTDVAPTPQCLWNHRTLCPCPAGDPCPVSVTLPSLARRPRCSGFLRSVSIIDLKRIYAGLSRAFPATFTPTYVCNLQGQHKQISRPHDCTRELKITC